MVRAVDSAFAGGRFDLAAYELWPITGWFFCHQDTMARGADPHDRSASGDGAADCAAWPTGAIVEE